MTKTVHIISHTHWDREWYLPYERHHMLLVELIDSILELFETDPEFKSFYLDGQTVLLDDYLEIRPENESLLKKHIEAGRLRIGPFYTLQDAFLSSSESHVRNFLQGHSDAKRWGQTTEIGYYPDTFGNVGQTPQLMDQLGFDVVAYGRGVKPTGFANDSNEEDNFVSSYSEMKWAGADGTELLGLLFANWYSNGNEIPTDPKQAKDFWTQKLADAESYASTDHLLMMNGCDHQPVQRDISEAIRVANELYDDYEFIHSDFPTYIKALLENVPEDLDTVHGELTSQETEGWYTLTNTASSRSYLKQQNEATTRLLEMVAEPLATLAYEVTGKYPHNMLEYAWKFVLQNQFHDSICTSGVDEVHDGMESRFERAANTARHVIIESLRELSDAIDTKTDAPEQGTPFIVFNTTGGEKTSVAEITLEVDRIPFEQEFPTQAYERLEQLERPASYKVIDSKGRELPADIVELDPRFNYDLPKDKFRQPYMARNLQVKVLVEQAPALSWCTLYLVPSDETVEQVAGEPTVLENEYLKVAVADNGTLTVTDKVHDTVQENVLVFEDLGDIGNEYVYKRPVGEEPILSTDALIKAEVIERSTVRQVLSLHHRIDVPISADEQLDLEQRKIIEFRDRKAQRVRETKPLDIYTTVTLDARSQQLDFETTLKNEMKDHRLRVLFPTAHTSEVHYADTVFETVERPNKVSAAWTNPENAQRMHRFVNIVDKSGDGVVVSTNGLNEYEVIVDVEAAQTLAVSLFRAVGELGDWGYFPTPGAQTLDHHYTFNYRLSFHGKADRQATLQQAIYSAQELITTQTTISGGQLPAMKQFLSVEGEAIALTTLKRHKETDDIITRLYNFTPNEGQYDLQIAGFNRKKSNILEEIEQADDGKVRPFEIVTHKWRQI